MKKLAFVVLVITAAGLNSCTIAETESDKVDKKVTVDPISDEDSTAAMEPDMDTVEKRNAMQLRSEITEYRMKIENTADQLQKRELDLSRARASKSQDFKRLEYFKSGDEVVKIKTYPTEAGKTGIREFYFRDNQLLFVMVEDMDKEIANEEGEDMSKSFFYHEGQIIVSEDYKISEATEEEKLDLTQGSALQDQAKEYLELIYKSDD